ncbi:unnamed protein product [Parascedosporium putredinis]|uniref:Uncharacterized protein n=1 Tax=Parascedosporium putredinis TaxID=1442378 RepID=A0A9P1H0L5_9PEZI|nr:unnamed protein product [Parascedosporium putredinis]CAI7991870.1 unnamed protein product [Parascedosporium putredinis]
MHSMLRKRVAVFRELERGATATKRKPEEADSPEGNDKGFEFKLDSVSSSLAFDQYVQLTLQQNALFTAVRQLRKAYNEARRDNDHKSTNWRALNGMARAARLYRDIMIEQAYSIMQTKPSQFLAFATLSLVAALPLLEDPGEVGFETYIDDEHEKSLREADVVVVLYQVPT